ncbi:protein NDNF-like [Pristis pectinata]|uniref:protein NDNF-like n=1 Tax=Pristis pectinata TaxID=685728 RepID=UPI00223E09F7|nr:protein NDNF-like [Pristis pectinata]
MEKDVNVAVKPTPDRRWALSIGQQTIVVLLLVEMLVSQVLCQFLLHLGLICLCQGHSPVFAQQQRWERVTNEAMYNYSPLLPDGTEITIFLFRDLPQSHYFQVRDKSPFSIRVNPCDAALEWKVTVHDWPAHGTYSSEKLNKLEWNQVTKRDLFSYKGNIAQTYVRASSHSTFHRLELLSTERNTQIRVYLTTKPENEPPYPELPFDPRVNVASVGQTAVTLAWKPSPSVLQDEENIQYCLLVNQKHNYQSLCAAENQAELGDGLWPDLPVVSIYSGGQEIYLTRTEDIQLPTHLLSNPISREPKMDVMQLCVGNRNIYSISELQPNTQYYFDVFAVNVLTNTSSAYTGTFAKTLQWPDPNILSLKEGIMIQVYVRKDGLKFYSFRPKTWHRRVQFTFHSCGKIYVRIERNGKVMVSESTENLKHFQLNGKSKARYIIGIKSMGPSEVLVKILVSTRPNKPLFPRLPDSLKLKSFDRLRTCNSVTVAWLGTSEQNRYCLYKREIGGQQLERERNKQNWCFGPETRRVSEKVGCRHFHHLNPQRAVAVEKVMGLKAGTTYLFDIYVIGHKGHSVKYQGKVIKTRKAC